MLESSEHMQEESVKVKYYRTLQIPVPPSSKSSAQDIPIPSKRLRSPSNPIPIENDEMKMNEPMSRSVPDNDESFIPPHLLTSSGDDESFDSYEYRMKKKICELAI